MRLRCGSGTLGRMSESTYIQALNPGEMVAQIAVLVRENAALREQNAALRAELERLRRRGQIVT